MPCVIEIIVTKDMDKPQPSLAVLSRGLQLQNEYIAILEKKVRDKDERIAILERDLAVAKAALHRAGIPFSLLPSSPVGSCTPAPSGPVSSPPPVAVSLPPMLTVSPSHLKALWSMPLGHTASELFDECPPDSALPPLSSLSWIEPVLAARGFPPALPSGPAPLRSLLEHAWSLLASIRTACPSKSFMAASAQTLAAPLRAALEAEAQAGIPHDWTGELQLVLHWHPLTRSTQWLRLVLIALIHAEFESIAASIAEGLVLNRPAGTSPATLTERNGIRFDIACTDPAAPTSGKAARRTLCGLACLADAVMAPEQETLAVVVPPSAPPLPTVEPERVQSFSAGFQLACAIDCGGWVVLARSIVRGAPVFETGHESSSAGSEKPAQAAEPTSRAAQQLLKKVAGILNLQGRLLTNCKCMPHNST